MVCVLIAAVMTTVEAALASFSKSRAQSLVDRDRPHARRLLEITQDPAPYTNATFFVRLVAQIVAIVLVTVVICNATSVMWERILYPVGIMVLVSFIFLGVFPLTLGRQHAESVALAAAGPLSALVTVLGPIPQVLIIIGNALTPGKGFSDGPFTSEAELRELVDVAEATDVIEAGERKMIHSVFDLADTIVKEVMVPRTDMVTVEATKTLRQGLSLALRSGFSRIPVVGEDLDDVVGVVYVKDVMRRIYDNPKAQAAETVASLMRKPTFCPDSKPVDDLLKEMQLTRSHLVIVVDEFGGTAGLATIEDVLEEIVGEIVDEYDEEITPVEDLGNGRYRVSTRLSLDDLGELFGRKIEDEDVDTVFGLMAKELKKVPIPGSTVEWEDVEFVAERALGRRQQVRTILVAKVTEEQMDPTDAVVAASTDPAEAVTSQPATSPHRNNDSGPTSRRITARNGSAIG